MKKSIFFAIALIGSFSLGFALNNFVTTNSKKQIEMKKVTGIGGIFFKCKDPDVQKEWYAKHLGIVMDKYGSSFEWRHSRAVRQ